MKAIAGIVLSLAAILAAGCELVATTDNSRVTVTDGAVTSLRTQQGNVVVDLNPNGQQRELNP